MKRVVHGLPISGIDPETGEHALETLAGASFLASFFYQRPGNKKIGDKQLDRAIEIVGDDEIFLLDNGAFSAFKQGIPIHEDDQYLEDYYDWAQDILERCPQAVAILPDVIGGTADQNAELAWQYAWEPERSLYVWHLHEPLDVLKYIIESGCGYIGFGSSAEYWQVGSQVWQERIDEAFGYLDALFDDPEFLAAYPRPHVHMLRGIGVQHDYRFDSADSVNVVVNWNRRRKHHGEQLGEFRSRVEGKASQGEVFGDQAAWGTPAEAADRLAEDEAAHQANLREAAEELGLYLNWDGVYVKRETYTVDTAASIRPASQDTTLDQATEGGDDGTSTLPQTSGQEKQLEEVEPPEAATHNPAEIIPPLPNFLKRAAA